MAPSGECLWGKSPPERMLVIPWRGLFLATFGLNLVVVAVLRDSRVVAVLCESVGTSYIVAVLRDRLLWGWPFCLNYNNYNEDYVMLCYVTSSMVLLGIFSLLPSAFFHHPSLLFPSTPGSTPIWPQIFSSIVLLYLSTHRTDSMDSSCFSFFSGMSILTLALCARLSWLLVSF